MRFTSLVLVCGADEIGTAVAHRLFRAHFRVALTASDDPLTLLRGNAFSQAAFTQSCEVEGVTAYKAVVTEAAGLIDRKRIPLLTAHHRNIIDVLNPDIIVDARSEPGATGIAVGDASLVIGIGEGLEAGVDFDIVIHPGRGHDMGRVIFRGALLPEGGTGERIPSRKTVRASSSGPITPLKRLGQAVASGEDLCLVGSEAIRADCAGVVCGHLGEGVDVPSGAVVVEVDEAGVEDRCFTISDLGRAVSGGVLESVVAWVADVGAFPRR